MTSFVHKIGLFRDFLQFSGKLTMLIQQFLTLEKYASYPSGNLD